MKIENKLISLIEKHHHLTAPELAKHLKVSRQYVTRLLKKLVNQKIIFKTGSTKNSLYHTKLPQDNYSIKSAIKNLQEDVVFTKLNYQLPILSSLSQNLKTVFEYSFTEIFNKSVSETFTFVKNLSN